MQVECTVIKDSTGAEIAGEWEAYAFGVVVSITTRQRHIYRNSRNEQPISLDHGALLHAADPVRDRQRLDLDALDRHPPLP